MSLDEFAIKLDDVLCNLNSDYEAKRQGNILLQKLSIVEASEGSFYHWLQKKNKLGGQYKVPRLTGDLNLINEIVSIEN